MKIPGIDISHWQGNFDLSKAKSEGFQFVIIKGGGSDAGRYVDSRFAENYEKAQAMGLPVGVYWYTNAKTVADAVADAQYMYEKILRGRRFELPVYLDVEGEMLKLPKRLLTDICLAWAKHLEALGYCVGIYGGIYTFRNHVYDEELQGIAHWLAQWSNAPDYDRDCLGMWQYGGETNFIRSNQVAGQVCDQNYMLLDYPAMIKAAGKNGFIKADGVEKPTVQQWQLAAMEDGFQFPKFGADGIWGAECESVARLAVVKKRASYLYPNLTKLVQRVVGVEADGLCGPQTDAAIRAYQLAHGLIPDGAAGIHTYKEMLGVEG